MTEIIVCVRPVPFPSKQIRHCFDSKFMADTEEKPQSPPREVEENNAENAEDDETKV